MRNYILDWIEKGHISEGDAPRAIALADLYPSKQSWRTFLDRLLLSVGTALTLAGIVFFFAANWQELGRFTKFAMVEALFVGTLAVVYIKGLDRLSGKFALLGACSILGTLFALVGQTYQTGANTFGLFATWAAVIVPWVWMGRFPVLWLLWIALVNVAALLYFHETTNLFWSRLQTIELSVLFAAGLNMVALTVWEVVADRIPSLKSSRWPQRILAAAVSGLSAALCIETILEQENLGRSSLAFLIWIALAFGVYRRKILDLSILAIAGLSAILVLAAFLAQALKDTSGFGLLFIGVVILGLSAAGGAWLLKVSSREPR